MALIFNVAPGKNKIKSSYSFFSDEGALLTTVEYPVLLSEEEEKELIRFHRKQYNEKA